jgi:beta-1,2-mannosyltransferase
MIAGVMYRRNLEWATPNLVSQLSVFHAASIWLRDFGVHMMVSRTVFPSPWKNFHPTWTGLTFLLAEIFDEKWDISARTVQVPMSSPRGITRRNLTFPIFLNVSSSGIFEGKHWATLLHLGKDPRMHVRRNPAGFLEPIVIFSPMISIGIQGSRRDWQVMGLILIFVDRLTVLLIPNSTAREKNWATLNINATHIDFVRAFFPLRVASCDLSSGACTHSDKCHHSLVVGPMRGGTQLVEMKPKVFSGWSRTHLKHCSCSDRFYRSHLVIIQKVNESYILAGVSAPFDFGVSGLERQRPQKCEGRDSYLNAIIAAGITSLDETSMTVLFYRQDRDRILARICEVVDWIGHLPETPFQTLGEDNAGHCAIEAAYNRCRSYPQGRYSHNMSVKTLLANVE